MKSAWASRRNFPSPQVRRAIDALLQSIVLTVGAYLVLGCVAPLGLAFGHAGVLPLRAWLVLLARPVELGITGLCVLVVCYRRREEREWWLLGAGALVAALVWAESGRVVVDHRTDMLPLLALVPTWVAVWAYGRFAKSSTPSYRVTATIGVPMLLAALALAPVHNSTAWNRLGLVSGRPDAMFVEDYTDHPLKDDYPPVTIRNNSLGYRDIEPTPREAGRKRVLLVGDSYVWGDGIPTADDTLPALLRNRLEKLAPGQYDVTSAAFPGIGAYGYRRAIQAMVPEVRPDVVVVGYLGDADLDPLDAQVLHDLLPESSLLARMIINLRTMQDLHETSVAKLRDTQWQLVYGAKTATDLFATLGDFGRQPGHRAVLVRYCGDGPPVAGVDSIAVPAPWRYQGYRSDLWYAKDSHPKPKLSRMLADWLASELVQPGSAGSGQPAAEIEKSEPVIPPGQEPLILAMVGSPPDIDHCQLRTADVQKTTIRATYDCLAGETRVVVLQHPSVAPGDALTTQRFALTSSSPNVPRAFLDAVAARVRVRESEFRWMLPKLASSSSASGAPGPFPWRITTFAVGALLVSLVAGRRRRSTGHATSADSGAQP